MLCCFLLVSLMSHKREHTRNTTPAVVNEFPLVIHLLLGLMVFGVINKSEGILGGKVFRGVYISTS